MDGVDAEPGQEVRGHPVVVDTDRSVHGSADHDHRGA